MGILNPNHQNEKRVIIIKDLTEILPQVILYIVTGYLIYSTYHFTRIKQIDDKNTEHILMSSLVIGYIYCELINLIPIYACQEIYILGMIICAVLLGYLLGKLIQNKYIVSILDFLKIRETGNDYYWNDLLDKSKSMKAKIIINNKIYEGMIHYIESKSNSPNIILSSYIVKNLNNVVIEDKRSDNNKVIILNTLKADSVEVIYDSDSYMCKDIQELCDVNLKDAEKYK